MEDEETTTPPAAAMPLGLAPGAVLTRRMMVPTTWDAATRTVEGMLSTGAPVRRLFGVETIAIRPDAVDLSRVALGQVRLLDHHNVRDSRAVLGVVETVWIDRGALWGRIRLAQTDEARRAEGQITRGELTGLSIGYEPLAFRRTGVGADGVEMWELERWALNEVSLVSVPAEPGAGIRSARAGQTEGRTMENEEVTTVEGASPPTETIPAANGASTRAMPPAVLPTAPAPAAPATNEAAIRAAERRRIDEIRTLGRSAGMADDVIDQAVAGDLSTRAFGDMVLSHLAAEQARVRTSSVHVTRDEGDTLRRGLSEAFAFRLGGGTPSDLARPYADHGIADMAAVFLGERSSPRSVARREEVLTRAFHSGSDFVGIVNAGLNTRVLATYEAAAPVYRRIAGQMTFRDFRPHDIVRPGDWPMLQRVGPGGEIKAGTAGDKRELVTVLDYGIQVRLTRQLLVDDRFGEIAAILAGQGTTIALFEELTFFAMKGTVGPTLIENNRAVFHASNGNLAGSGGAITVDTVSAGRAALRKMKRLDGMAMGLTARTLLVSPDLETAAERFVTPVVASETANVNPFSSRLDVVVGGQLTGNAWELYADTAFGSNWVWGLLDGYTAPRVRIDTPFGTSGVGVSIEHDFGCGAADFRFGYRNPGV